MSLPRPTLLGWNGLLFYAVLVTAFFAAPYANLFFLLVAFLTVLGTWGWLATWRHGAGMSARLEDVEAVPAGTPAVLLAVVDEAGRTRRAVRVEVKVGDAKKPLRLSAGPDGDLRGEVAPMARGVYPLRKVRWVTSWPFELFCCSGPAPAPADLVVYPAPIDRGEARGGADLLADLCGPGGGAAGLLQPSSLREYRDGESLHRVHWKASARRGSLIVQEWEGGSGNGFEIVLDRRTHAATLEDCLSVLSALTLAAREGKEILTLHTQGLSASFGSGHRPWDDLLRFLAGAQTLGSDGGAPPPASPAVARLPMVTAGAS